MKFESSLSGNIIATGFVFCIEAFAILCVFLKFEIQLFFLGTSKHYVMNFMRNKKSFELCEFDYLISEDLTFLRARLFFVFWAFSLIRLGQ
jgi:hypothetical protein